jgi:hypothetical protein
MGNVDVERVPEALYWHLMDTLRMMKLAAMFKGARPAFGEDDGAEVGHPELPGDFASCWHREWQMGCGGRGEDLGDEAQLRLVVDALDRDVIPESLRDTAQRIRAELEHDIAAKVIYDCGTLRAQSGAQPFPNAGSRLRRILRVRTPR